MNADVSLAELLVGAPLSGRDLLSIDDLTPAELKLILDVATRLKARRKTLALPKDEHSTALQGRSVALLFEKPSLRTRVTFQVAIEELGGSAIFLGPQDVVLGIRESVADVTRNLDRWVHAIVARVFSHDNLATIARYASVPVINALSDFEHPCQGLADVMTLRERRGDLSGLKLAYVGDANNVSNSLMLLAPRLGMSMAIATPPAYAPPEALCTRARAIHAEFGGSLTVSLDPREAVSGADVVYTDTWISMGQEAEAEQRRRDFAGFQVDVALMNLTRPGAFFMHCLPAHRGEEVTDAVMDSPVSVIFDQAENRLHVQKALMLLLCGSQ